MRLRNVPGARETIIENKFSIQQPEQMKENGQRYSKMTIRSTLK